jgi:IgA Peptidase M64.
MMGNWAHRILTGLLLAVCLQNCAPSMDVSELERVYCYLAAREGRGVDVVIMGDGFSRSDIQNGSYGRAMEEAAEALLTVQPYRRYRDYFNVYVVEAVSEESGISDLETTRRTRFGVRYTGSVRETGMQVVQEDLCFSYARRAPVRVEQTLIVMVANSARYGGTCHMWSSGKAIAICPLSREENPHDFAAIVQHEAGGHGFARLGDEYISTEERITMQEMGRVYQWQQRGYYSNISLTGDVQQVPWNVFTGRPGYEDVGAFEGAYTFLKGVWRSEHLSCMVNNIAYYNAPSRLAIVQRITSLSGEKFSWERFWAEDAADAQSMPPRAESAFAAAVEQKAFLPLAPPILRD